MPEVVLNLEYVVYKEDLETLSVKIMSPSTLARSSRRHSSASSSVDNAKSWSEWMYHVRDMDPLCLCLQIPAWLHADDLNCGLYLRLKKI